MQVNQNLLFVSPLSIIEICVDMQENTANLPEEEALQGHSSGAAEAIRQLISSDIDDNDLNQIFHDFITETSGNKNNEITKILHDQFLQVCAPQAIEVLRNLLKEQSDDESVTDFKNIAPFNEARLYEGSLKCYLANQFNAALVGFGLLSSGSSLTKYARYGFAATLAGLDEFAAASRLSASCLELEFSHPRAMLLSGYCDWKRSKPNGARVWLAKTARFARKNDAYKSELRSAQRVLLSLQFEEN